MIRTKSHPVVKKSKKSSKKSSRHCPTCRQVTTKDGHLCVPVMRGDKKCDWCGSLIADQRHLCNDKIKELAYICNSCGRTAVNAQYLCRPQKVRYSTSHKQ